MIPSCLSFIDMLYNIIYIIYMLIYSPVLLAICAVQFSVSFSYY